MNNPLVQPDPGLYIWTIATFLLLVALLARFAWRPLLDALERRQQAIVKALDDARQAKKELERLNAESVRIINEARAEAERIMSSTRTDAVRFGEDLKKKARADAELVVKNAEREIDQQTARALERIRHESIDLSVAMAAKILQRDVTAADTDRLMEETFREIQARRPS
jgi:F-type H+-transporting ATPase subunit b